MYRTNYNDRTYEIDLLYLEKDGNIHYCLIKNLGTLLGQNDNRAFICKNCLQIFSYQQALSNHQSISLNRNFFKINLPKEITFYFNKHHFKSRLPIAIYDDFEATNLKIQTVQPSNEAPYNQNISKQEVNSFGIYIRSDYKNLTMSQYYDYIGTDAKEKFVETIVLVYNDISKKLSKYSKANKTVKLTPTQQQQQFNNATNCHICNVPFNEQVTKIREHNHFNGKYRGAACQSCNTQEGKASKEIPVFFHNGSKYDFHFIVTELMKYQDKYNKVEVLPKTSEETSP